MINIKYRYFHAVALCSIILLTYSTQHVNAQSWRWGVRGGSSSSESTDWETVKDMATDQNGNTYILSNVYQSGLNVTGGGASVTGRGVQDILITSYRCDGSFRWKRLIGGPYDDYAFSLQVDSIGGVYAAFALILAAGTSPVGHIDTDTTIVGRTNRSLYLVKYDTAGNYQWLKRPQPDTISLSAGLTYTGTIDMNADGQGNVYWLCHLPPAGYENGASVINTSGVYMLRYDAGGNYQGHINMDMYRSLGAAGIRDFKMQRDNRSGRFYISGCYFSGLFTMGGNIINKPMFVGAFSSDGSLLWHQTNTLSTVGAGFYHRAVVDDSCNIYLGGRSQQLDTFNGYIISSGVGLLTRPFIIKMDSNGNSLWALDAIPTVASFAMGGLALRNKDEVILPGTYPDAIRWPGLPDTLHHGVPGGAYLTFITRFNAHTGQVLGMERLPSANPTGHSISNPSVTVSDGRNNVYVGGEFQGQLNINGSNLLKTGGNTDWFVAKYGHDNCGCTAGPSGALFTKTYLNDSTVQFAKTGAAQVDDTLYWSFGDTTTAKGTLSPQHIYRDTGTFKVCLRITNGCSDSTWCDTVRISNPCILAAGRPLAAFTYNIDKTKQQVQVVYTGSQPYDSVVYNFGDGNTMNAVNHTHTYITAGSYTVCATVYNTCGSNTTCHTVDIPVSIPNITGSGGILIYPNPANDVLYVEGAQQGAKAELFDMMGRKLYNGAINQHKAVIDIQQLPQGNYIIQLTDNTGNRMMGKVMKK